MNYIWLLVSYIKKCSSWIFKFLLFTLLWFLTRKRKRMLTYATIFILFIEGCIFTHYLEYFYMHIKDFTNTIKWWSDTFQAMFYCKYQTLFSNLTTLQTLGIFILGKIIFNWANQYCIPNNCLQIKKESRHSDFWTENWRHSLELPPHIELKNNLVY